MVSKAQSGVLGLPLRIVLPVVPFPVAVAISMALHFALVLTWLLLPRVEPAGAPLAYRVRLVEAPSRPAAKPIEVLREAVPSVQPERVPPGAVEALRAPPAELPALPDPLPTVKTQPEPSSAESTGQPGTGLLAPSQPAHPLAAPALPERSRAPAAAAPVAPAVAPAPPSGTPAALPKTPPLPPAPPPLTAPEKGVSAARSDSAEVAVPLPPPPEEAEKPAHRNKPATAMDTLRSQVRPPPAATRGEVLRQEPPPPNPLADLARRRYRNGLQSRVRDNHSYPAEFSCGIEAIMRITLARDGSLVGSQLLQSSGDSRYDYAVDLTIRATHFQALPDELPGDTYTENLRFTPKRCPSSNP